MDGLIALAYAKKLYDLAEGPQGEPGEVPAAAFAPTYSTSAKYAVGDYVYKSSKLYKCTTAINTPESWTADHWEEVAIATDVSNLKSDINDYVGEHTANLYNKEADTRGKTINASGDILDNANYKISDYIYIGANKTFTFENKYDTSVGSGAIYIAYYDENKSFSVRVAVNTDNETTTITTNQYRQYIRFIMFDNTPDFMCNMGDSILPYSPYGFEYCDYLKQVKENSDSIDALRYYSLTDPYKLPFIYGYRLSSSAFAYSTTALVMAHPVRVRQASKVSCKNTDIKMQICYKSDESDSWQYFGYNDGQSFEMPFDGLIIIGAKRSDNAKIDNNTILDNLSVNLVSGDAFPLLFDERSRSIFNSVPYELYIGQHVDETSFVESTNYATIISAFDALVDNSYITKKDLGVSSDGVNHVYAYTCTPQGKYTLDKANSKATRDFPTVVLIGSIHGYEKTATYGLHYLLKDLKENSIHNTALMYLRSNVRLVIVPACVPYGWENVDRYNANGINIDRNFGTYGWADYNPEDSAPWGYNAKGSSPFSEVETQIIMNLLSEEKALHNALLVMDIHTNGVNTINTDQICVADPSFHCEMNEYSARTYDGALSFIATNKPFIDSLYDVNIDASSYGYCALGAELPLLYTWSQEQSDLIGVLLEVLAGSRGDYLGEKLTTYSPHTIKLAGEQIGNYIIKLLAELSK